MSSVWKVGGTAGISGYAEVDDSGVMTASGGFVGAVTGNVTGNTSGTSATAAIFATSGAPQTIDMADAAVELVYGIAAGAGQVLITNSRLQVDANSGATEDLTIDTTAAGLVLCIQNTGGESIVLKTNGGSTIGTIATGGTGLYIGGLFLLSA